MKKINEMNLAELKERLVELMHLKTQALNDQHYETAAQLRDEERRCGEAIARMEDRKSE